MWLVENIVVRSALTSQFVMLPPESVENSKRELVGGVVFDSVCNPSCRLNESGVTFASMRPSPSGAAKVIETVTLSVVLYAQGWISHVKLVKSLPV
jgi:hypothetical protein